jgi:hypothetical protein
MLGELSLPLGLLSFPLHGVSLALDFPQRDKVNERLFKNWTLWFTKLAVGYTPPRMRT